MKYPTMKFVFDRKKVATKEKKGLVQIEVTSERKRKWISANVKLYADQWDNRKKVIRHEDSIQLNSVLDAQMAALNEFVGDLIKRNVPFDFDKLDDFLSRRTRSVSFIDFVRERIEERMDIEESTRKQHKTLLAALEAFGKMNYADNITPGTIQEYYEYILSTGVTKPTAYNYIKRLRVYLHLAMKYGIIEKDPSEGMHFERGKFESRKYLTEEELRSVKECKISIAPVRVVRDLFLFQCYTGLAYSDFSKFDFKNDVEKRNRKYVIADKRLKTKEDYFIVLLSPALEILKKYEYELPKISNVEYNRSLKVMAMFANVNKNITTHVARHTFAVFALNNGVPMEIVSKMLGHTNIRTTQIYAKVLNKEVEKGFDLLESKISGE